jgi:drug/metabolite transporter (DMT)-like permease
MITSHKHSTTAHLALLATNIFFAINFTAIKYLVNHGLVLPFGLNLIRVALTTALLWIMFLFRPEKVRIDKADWGRFVLCALTGIAINQLLFVKGLSMTYSIHASLLMLTTPILITISAAWLLRERLSMYKIAGLAMGIAGSAVLIMSRNHSGNATDVLWGDILVIINAVSYTAYFILVKPLMLKYKPAVVIRMAFTIGLFMILPFCFNEFIQTPWSRYGATDFMILALITCCGTFLAYLFNVYGIKKLGASVAGSYIYSQPVFAALIAMLVLGEELSFYKIIAAIFIFTGVYLANKSK